MKNRILISAIILFSPFLIKGQNLILSAPETGMQYHQASNSITFANGYSYQPAGGNLTAVIGPDNQAGGTITGDITYSSAIDPDSYAINTGLGVGRMPGNLSVDGSADYNIPINIPGGINGLQPSISLNYSSNFNDGIMGIGWNVAGISAITRTNKTIYNDGMSDAIRCDLTDKYALNGKRLVLYSGSYGSDNSEYRTEQEEYSRVVAMSSGTRGPGWFKVYTKSGLIYEFGNTSDSKITNAAGCILSWKVNKISDRYNNYITFSYITSNNEYPIGSIEYTGNSATSQSPFAQIVFNYKNRADVSTYTYAGKEFTRSILLDNIVVKSNGQTFKKYGLTYMRDSYAQLLKVTESSSQNAPINPTVFAWTHQTEQFTQTTNYTSTDNDLTFVGDFNGDGREDVVSVPNKTSYTTSDKWKLYLADADGNLVYSTQGDLNTTFETFLVGDFNGDGLTDLMMQQNAATQTYPGEKNYYFYQSTGTTFTRSTFYYDCYDKTTMDVVDYNGDGILEFLYHTSSGSWTLYSYSGASITSGSIPSFGKSYIQIPGMPCNHIVDFNGDGCSDLLVLTMNGYYVYEFKGTNQALIQTNSGTNINNSYNLLFGDFNGDGLTDIVKNDNQFFDWNLMILTSGGFQEHGLYNLDWDFDFFTYNQVYAHDVNGDGRTDIVMYGQGTNPANSSNRINVALSSNDLYSTSYFTEYVSNSVLSGPEPSFGDFNGDGRCEILYKNGTTSKLFSFASGTPSHLIKTVIDGVGAKKNLTYLPMSNNAVYTRGTGATYPVSDYSSSQQLVSQVSGDNGIGGTSSLTYQYTGAKIHREGKGLLGFSKITTTNSAAGIVSETESGYNTTYYYPQVNNITKKTTGGASIESTSNTWTQMVLDASTKRILPYVQSSTQTNSLTGYSITNSISSMDSYGNPTEMVKDYGNGVTETTVNDYSGNINTTDWLLGRIGSSTVTFAKSGEQSVIQSVRYTYAADGIQKPDIIYYYEGTPLAYTKNHDYDSKGNLTQVATSGTSIGTSQVNYTYNTSGTRILTATDALGHVTTNTWDDYGKLLTETDWLNNVITHQYDGWDNQSTVSFTNGGQTTTTYLWTGSNKPTYGVYGITQTGLDGSLAIVWYDILGRAIRTEKKGLGGTMILTDTEYNALGQVYRVSEPYFAGGSPVWAETYAYDGYGRANYITRNTGRNTSYTFSGATTSETTAGKTSSKTYGPDGTLTSATDNGGTINYAYYPDGKAKTITAPGGVVTSMQYGDAARNQTLLSDPSAGYIYYTYNSRGQIITQTDAQNRLTTNYYLSDGRPDYTILPEGTTSYSYNINTKQLTGINSPNNVSRSYGYDSQGRVSSLQETIAGSNFPTTFTYDSYGRLSTRTHPSGIVETMNYNSNGYLSSISAGGATRYTITSMNARQQLTGSTYGSNLNTTFGFDSYGYPTSTQTGSIQDYRYSFDATTGNLTTRQNYLRNKSESFGYDNLDRLTSVTGPQNLTITFNDNGNISTKSDIGTTAFGYGNNAGPYALTSVESSTSVIPALDQNVTYNSYQKVNTTGEGTHTATFIYNADRQRAKMDITENGTTILTRWYAGGSDMKETDALGTRIYTYLGGDAYSAPVVAMTEGGTTNYFYLLRDHLGNITHKVNTSNTVEAEYSYDAWGRRRNPADWGYDLTGQPDLFAGRGFTSHEHLPWFNLVNMNGRLYDPLVGRFLSVDNVVQDPAFTQSYNRYSYCWNNPLKYADPDGNKLYIKGPIYYNPGYYGSPHEEVSGGFAVKNQDAFFADAFDSHIQGYGEPGQGNNGDGAWGTYYDWSTGEYRCSAKGHEAVDWNYVQKTIAPYASTIDVSDLQGANKVNAVKEVLSNKDAVKNFGGIAGLTSSYHEAKDIVGGRGVEIELEYTSPNVNNTSNWIQVVNIKGFAFLDNGGWYYNDRELAKHRHGNTISFYDSPYEGLNWNGSKILELSLYTDNKFIFTLQYGFHLANQQLTIYSLTVCPN